MIKKNKKKKKKKKRRIKRKLEQPTLPQNKPNKENEYGFT